MNGILFKDKTFLCFVLIISGLITAAGVFFPINADEGLYWEHGNHLAWGYYTHPPLTGFINYIFTSLFGDNSFALRLPSTLMYLGNLVIAYRLALKVTGNREVAFNCSALYGFFNVVLVFGIIMTTDCPMLFFYGLAVYGLHEAIVNGRKKFWYLSGLWVGLMLMSKMLSVLIFPGVFLFLVLNREYRKVFKEKEIYLAVLIAFLVYLPFLIWNYFNDWIHFAFTFQIRSHVKNDTLYSLSVFFVSWFGILSPLPFFLFFPMIWKNRKNTGFILKKNSLPEQKSALFCLYIVLGGLVFYLLLSFKHVVGIHWYSVLLLPLSLLLALYLKNEKGKNRKILRCFVYASQLSFILPLFFILVFPKVLPDKMLYISKVGEEQKPLSNIFGWKEGGKAIDKAYREYSQKYDPLVLSFKDYGIGGVMKFYMPSHPDFVLIDIADAIHAREYLRWEVGLKKTGVNFFFVSDMPTSFERMEPYVKTIKHLDPVVIKDEDGRILRVFYLTLGLDYQGGENTFARINPVSSSFEKKPFPDNAEKESGQSKSL